MLIPSIDLQDGRVVQLIQGARLAVASDDLDGWIDRFSPFPVVQVVDLDAARGRGDNAALVAVLARRLSCQVGGGVRTPDRARQLLDAGARRVILGSALFGARGVSLDRAGLFADALGMDALIAAVDSRGGRVTVDGWTAQSPVSADEAVGRLSPFVGGFLCTQVDTEGTMTGLDLAAIEALRRRTPRRLIAAGGIRSLDEVQTLDARGVDAVVGMALYTGVIDLGEATRRWGRDRRPDGGA